MRSYYPSGGALRRALASLTHERPRTFLMKLLAELGYRRVVLLVRPLDEPIPEGPPHPDVTFSLLGEHRIDEYAAYRGADRDVIAGLLARGVECHLLECDGRIVSSCWAWIGPHWSEYLGSATPTEDGDVYLSDAWTDPAYRGRAYAHVLCLHQLRQYHARGLRRAMRATVPENYSALKLHAKSGFRPLGVSATMRLGPWRRSFRRDWRGPFP